MYDKKQCNGGGKTIDDADLHLNHTKQTESDAVVKVKSPATEKVPQPSLMAALIFTFGPAYAFGSCFKLLHDILMFLSPMLLK